jgi:hypothetical protein
MSFPIHYSLITLQCNTVVRCTDTAAYKYSACTDKVEHNCHFAAGTALFAAKPYEIFPIRFKYHSIKTVNSTCLYNISSCREPGNDGYVELHQWTHCTKQCACCDKSLNRPRPIPSSFSVYNWHYSSIRCYIRRTQPLKAKHQMTFSSYTHVLRRPSDCCRAAPYRNINRSLTVISSRHSVLYVHLHVITSAALCFATLFSCNRNTLEEVQVING